MSILLEILSIKGVSTLVDTILMATTIGLLFFTGLSAIQTKRTVKKHDETLEQQQDAIRREYRPMMVANYIAPTAPGETLQLEISNVGKTVAKDVQIIFIPSLPSPNLKKLQKNQHSGHKFKSSLLELPLRAFVGKKFPTWVPGQKTSCFFWALHKDGKLEYSAEGIPRTQRVRIDYKDESEYEYKDEFSLDPSIFHGMLFPPTENEKQTKSLKSIAESVEKLVLEQNDTNNILKKFKNGSYNQILSNNGYKNQLIKKGELSHLDIESEMYGDKNAEITINSKIEKEREKNIIYNSARSFQDFQYKMSFWVNKLFKR